MKKITCNIILNQRELQKEIGRFHFKETDLLLVSKVYQEMQKKLRVSAYYERTDNCLQKAQVNYDYVILFTLGADIDVLKDIYLKAERLSEAYILDCLSMLILSQAYQKVLQRISVEEQKDVSEFVFWEDVYEITELEAFLGTLPKIEITCDMNMALHPSKSVLLLAKAKSTDQRSTEKTCAIEFFTERCKTCKHKCH